MDWKELGSTTWGAAQASISVLLVMSYGYGASAYKLLTKEGTKNISHVTTTIFLPALFFSEIGPEATFSKLAQYWPIIAIALWNLLLSYLYASLGRRIFKSAFPFPRWIVPSCMYNNAITLPLLMLESLGNAGALDGIITDPSAMPEALRRAKNYFLLNALVYTLTKFSLGPSMMSSPHEPDAELFSESTCQRTTSRSVDGEHLESEFTPLVPTSQSRIATPRNIWGRLKGALNPPLLGALVAMFIGIVPPLHAIFMAKGGAFTGSLTQSIEKMGNVYTAVQILVVGAQLYAGTRSRTTKKLPKLAMIYLLAFRFVFMPTLSISLICGVRRWKPKLLLKDPVFDFALMIAPVGPPGVTIAAVGELAKLSEEDNGVIARMLTISYMVTPLISIPIAVALTMIKKQALAYTLS